MRGLPKLTRRQDGIRGAGVWMLNRFKTYPRVSDLGHEISYAFCALTRFLDGEQRERGMDDGDLAHDRQPARDQILLGDRLQGRQVEGDLAVLDAEGAVCRRGRTGRRRAAG